MTDTADTTDTDIAVDAPAPADAPADFKFPKVIARDEEASITHYSPKPHVEVDPTTRHS